MCTNNVFTNFKGIKPGGCFAPPPIDVTGEPNNPAKRSKSIAKTLFVHKTAYLF